MSPVNRKEPAGVVRRAPARRHPPQIEPGPHVVRAAGVREDIRHLERRVELEPVRAARAEPAEVADGDAREPGIVEPGVAVEPRYAKAGARARRPVDVKRIHGVEVDAVVADPEIVEQVGSQRMRVRAQPVLVHTRLGHRSDRNRRVENIGVEAIVPVVADVQPDLVAQILVDAGEHLVDVVAGGTGRLEIIGRARPVRLGVVPKQVE